MTTACDRCKAEIEAKTPETNGAIASLECRLCVECLAILRAKTA
jgi:hypothetical protein